MHIQAQDKALTMQSRLVYFWEAGETEPYKYTLTQK